MFCVCHTVAYCSVHCQKNHWKLHKKKYSGVFKNGLINNIDNDGNTDLLLSQFTVNNGFNQMCWCVYICNMCICMYSYKHIIFFCLHAYSIYISINVYRYACFTLVYRYNYLKGADSYRYFHV
jgi:hypothetical protein